jgi:Flp pilus assembly protein TadG
MFTQPASPAHCSTHRRKRRGVAAVEFAVCLPVIVLLVIGTIEACSMIFLKQTLSVAAYEGARTAIIPGVTTAQVRTACQQVLADRNIQGGQVTISPSNVDALNPGDFVDVSVSAPCSANSVVPNKFYRGRTITASASMMIEF